jgi:uncharacterized damage-inducible protein DinB
MNSTAPQDQLKPTGEPLLDMFRHHLWANLRLLDACAGLSDAQLDANTLGAFGSIRDTLTHLAGAEESYLARLTGERPADGIRRGEFPGMAKLREHLLRSGEGLIEVAGRANTVGHSRVAWEDRAWQVPASLILAQAINHATEHRAQIMVILTQQGIEPPEVSGWEYVVMNLPEEAAG